MDELKQKMGDLLAFIHRDGGQYIDNHGWEKAIKDGIDIVLAERAKQDDPITRTVKCGDCGGSGGHPQNDYQGDDTWYLSKCPTCNGKKEITEELVAVVNCQDKCQHWDCCGELCGNYPENDYTPLTNATLKDHPISTWKWRKRDLGN